MLVFENIPFQTTQFRFTNSFILNDLQYRLRTRFPNNGFCKGFAGRSFVPTCHPLPPRRGLSRERHRGNNVVFSGLSLQPGAEFVVAVRV